MSYLSFVSILVTRAKTLAPSQMPVYSGISTTPKNMYMMGLFSKPQGRCFGVSSNVTQAKMKAIIAPVKP